MISRDKIVTVEGVRYTLHLSLELGKDVWNVRIYYRRSTHEAFSVCDKTDALYKEFASFVSVEWIASRTHNADCIRKQRFPKRFPKRTH